MTKDKYYEARVLLLKIEHLEELINLLKGNKGGLKHVSSLFSLDKDSQYQTFFNLGEIDVMVNAFEIELKRLYAEFEKV